MDSGISREEYRWKIAVDDLPIKEVDGIKVFVHRSGRRQPSRRNTTNGGGPCSVGDWTQKELNRERSLCLDLSATILTKKAVLVILAGMAFFCMEGTGCIVASENRGRPPITSSVVRASTAESAARAIRTKRAWKRRRSGSSRSAPRTRVRGRVRGYLPGQVHGKRDDPAGGPQQDA